MNSLKKEISILGIVVLLFVIMVSMVACSGNSPTTSLTSAAPAKSQVLASTTQSQAAAPTTQPQAAAPPLASQTAPAQKPSAPASSSQAAGGSLGDLLGKAAGIASMKYDMVTTAPNNPTTTATMWAKKAKIRMETTQQGQNVITLINGDAKTMYMYQPDKNTATKMDFGQAPKSAADSNAILQYTPTLVGIETLDGKVCQVIQYTVSGTTTKSWIWMDKGLPVRMQVNTPMGTATTDFKNYDFSDIPDSLFELPAGVQITTLGLPSGLPTNLPSGLPTNLPSGFPTNLPSGFPTNLPPGLPPR
jgi:outer membrane lipoprotein-sorting protein